MEDPKNTLNDPVKVMEGFLEYYEKMMREYDAEHMREAYETTREVCAFVKVSNFEAIKPIYAKYQRRTEELGTGFHQVMQFVGKLLESNGGVT